MEKAFDQGVKLAIYSRPDLNPGHEEAMASSPIPSWSMRWCSSSCSGCDAEHVAVIAFTTCTVLELLLVLHVPWHASGSSSGTRVRAGNMWPQSADERSNWRAIRLCQPSFALLLPVGKSTKAQGPPVL